MELSIRHKVSVLGLLSAEDTVRLGELAQEVERSVVSSGDGLTPQLLTCQRVPF